MEDTPWLMVMEQELVFSPLSFMGWSFIVNALLFHILLKIMNKPDVVKRVFSEAKLLFWFGGTISYIVYGIVVWGFTQAPIPLVSALRETSVIIALLIGTIFLKERFTIFKTLSILVIFAGVVFTLKFFNLVIEYFRFFIISKISLFLKSIFFPSVKNLGQKFLLKQKDKVH